MHWRGMGVPTEVIQSCASDPALAELPPSQRAILKLALKTSQDPLSVTDDDFQTLRDYGLTDGEIMEVTMMAAVENFFNTWARVSQIPIEGDDYRKLVSGEPSTFYREPYFLAASSIGCRSFGRSLATRAGWNLVNDAE